MLNKKFVLFLIIIILTSTRVAAADFYPEMGMDPFYSSINPFSLIEDEKKQSSDDSVLGLFKKFKNKKIDKKEKQNTPEVKPEPTLEKKVAEENKNSDKEKETVINEKNETFVTPEPKKHLSKTELERELRKEERENKKLEEQKKLKLEGKPVSIKEKLLFFKKNKKTENEVKSNPNIELTADYMEYYPERYEVEAIGNAKVTFIAQNTTLCANKIVFNYDQNILTATEDVVLTSPEAQTEGDFLRLDLKKPEGWIENPITTSEDIKISAKEAYIYSDKIEEYDGVAKILSNETLSLGARSFASYVDQGGILNRKKNEISPEYMGIYKLKAENIIINSKNDHEEITIKNADLYLRKYKIAVIPSIKIVTNKAHNSVETNIPEFGSQNMLGMHIGPAVVLKVPGGSTLKLAPILTYDDDEFGLGGIARFRSQNNMTEVAYGSSKDQILIRGRHKLAPGLLLHYSRYTNQNEWFLGYRMPKYSAHLDYSRSDYIRDLKLHFSQLYSAGVFVDRIARRHTDFDDAEGRFRWMTQTYKPIYRYSNEEGNIMFQTGLVAQTSATVYTSGERVGLFRIGPALNTKVGPWQQALIYYQTASDGRSPFGFDRYRYGRSNFVLIESLNVCKYLTLGYLASLAMNNDYSNDKMFQESRILVSLGPEYARFTIGYDAYRHNTMFVFSMLVGTKDSDIEFKKSVINNPDKFGKKNKKPSKKKKSYKRFIKHDIVMDE